MQGHAPMQGMQFQQLQQQSPQVYAAGMQGQALAYGQPGAGGWAGGVYANGGGSGGRGPLPAAKRPRLANGSHADANEIPLDY